MLEEHMFFLKLWNVMKEERNRWFVYFENGVQTEVTESIAMHLEPGKSYEFALKVYHD
jgi:hypothetical protein